MKRRLAVWLLMVLFSVNSAQATLSPGLDRLQTRYQAGDPIALQVQAEVSIAQDLSPLTLDTLKDLLPRTRLSLQLSQPHSAQAALSVDEQPLLHYLYAQDENTAWTTLAGRAYTAPAGQDPLAGLLDGALPFTSLPVEGLQDLLAGHMPTLWQLLSPYADTQRQSRTIKNVGTAALQIRHDMTAEQWTALWPQAKDTLLDAAAKEGLTRTALDSVLQDLQFEGAISVRQYTDRDGNPMGWQFSGTVTKQGLTPRKVVLHTGYGQAKGLYISLRAPAVQGADDLQVQVSLRHTQGDARRGLEGDAVWRWRIEKERDSGKARLSLTSRDTDAGETIKGTLSVDIPAQGSRPRRITQLKPDLLWADDTLSGTAMLTQREAGRDALEMLLTLRLAADSTPLPVPPAQAVNPAALNPDQLAAEKAALETALLAPLKDLLFSLPEDRRLALIHDMGRTARTQGESVAPVPNYQVTPDNPMEEEIP